MNHTEMMEEETGNADMCGYVHGIEGAGHKPDFIFPSASHKKLSLNFWCGNNFSQI